LLLSDFVNFQNRKGQRPDITLHELHEKQRVTRFASHSYVKQKKQCMMKLTSILAFAFLLVSSISHTPLFEQYFLSVFSCLLGYAAFSSIFLL
jgi:hypothetical protein